MFQSFYDSFWQHPLLLWIAPIVFLLLLPKGGSTFTKSLRVFTWLTIVDPLVTGPILSAVDLGDQVESMLMIAFVIIGDFRWFFFFEFFDESGRGQVDRRGMLRVLGLSLIVPVVQGALLRLFPEQFVSPHQMYMVYELCFFLLVIVFLLFRVRRFEQSARSYKSELCFYALGYYGLWALADQIILTWGDIGFALRVVPNLLYYSLFLPFAYARSNFRATLKGTELGIKTL